jgi:hypothetical protein
VNELTAEEVAAALGLGRAYHGWLEDLASQPPVADPATLPEPAQAGDWLRRLGCDEATVADTVATLFSPDSDPARQWLLERCRRRLLATMGEPAADRGQWPQLPPALGTAGGCFHLHVFLATMGDTLSWHAARNIPEAVSWSTLADLGRHTDRRRLMTGSSGIDEPWWMTLHLRAILYELGRLQYVTFRLGSGPEQPMPWIDESTAYALGDGFRPGDDTLGVHIPGGSPLRPVDCEESMRAASSFFDAYFPVPRRRVATCSSWLLDDQLPALLPAASNIVAFGRSFHLVDGWRDGDYDVVNFVFNTWTTDLDTLPQSTTLERAVVAHLRSGGHFHWRTGWRDLPAAR